MSVISYRYDDILAVVPDELLNRLIVLRDADSAICWQYGDIVNEIYDVVVRHRLQIDKLGVCAFVSFMVDSNRAATTIMRYALVAQFYTPDERERYSVLPFTHLEFAMRFDNWRELLEFDLDLTAQLGYPPSRARLEKEFCGTYEPPALVLDVPDVTGGEAMRESAVTAAVGACLSACAAPVSALQRNDYERYREIAELLSEIKRRLIEIASNRALTVVERAVAAIDDALRFLGSPRE